MPLKRFVPPTRASGNRDAKLIIIATEGECTEQMYFDDLAFLYRRPNVYVKVLNRLESASAPISVLVELDKFCRQYSLRKSYDELWLVVDVDRWGSKKLSEVTTLCEQKEYGYAISNPCFELWLLLHLKSLDDYSEITLQEFRENRRPTAKHKRTRLELELVDILGSYSKSKLDTKLFLGTVELAIDRAKELDRNPDHRWPNDLGTRVYQIAEKIIKK